MGIFAGLFSRCLGFGHVVGEHLVDERVLVLVVGVEGYPAHLGGAADLGDGDLLEGRRLQKRDEGVLDRALRLHDSFVHFLTLP